MYRIETRNKPRGALVRAADRTQHCVRVWKNSPEDLVLQLWSGRRYMLVALSPQEARDIVDALRTAAYQIEKEPADAA